LWLSLAVVLAPSAWIRLVASDSNLSMLRIQGNRDSLLAALIAHWADQQLQISASRPAAPTTRLYTGQPPVLDGQRHIHRPPFVLPTLAIGVADAGECHGSGVLA
jgi:hypothetical protein